MQFIALKGNTKSTVNNAHYCVPGYSQGQKKEGYKGHSSSQGRTPQVCGTVSQGSVQTKRAKQED